MSFINRFENKTKKIFHIYIYCCVKKIFTNKCEV